MTNLLQPPCAEVSGASWNCPRCNAGPANTCGDTAARAAQEAVRTLGAGVPVRDLHHPLCSLANGNRLENCQRGACDDYCRDVAAYNAQLENGLRSIASASQTPPTSPDSHPQSPEAPTALPGGKEWQLDVWMIGDDYMAFSKSDGANLILAANHHAALVEALEALVEAPFRGGILRSADNARALLKRIRAGGSG